MYLQLEGNSFSFAQLKRRDEKVAQKAFKIKLLNSGHRCMGHNSAVKNPDGTWQHKMCTLYR